MDQLPHDFHKQALELIHYSNQSQAQLATNIDQLLKKHYFVGEKVTFPSGESTILGQIVEISRENSPSDKENQLQYSVETSNQIFKKIPFCQLSRKASITNPEVCTFINNFAKRSDSKGLWIVQDKYLAKYNIKDKVCTLLATMNGTSKHSSSNGPAAKKQRLSEMNGVGTLKACDDSSSSDDEPLRVGVRKSGVGMAPHSTGAKKSTTKKPVTKKEATKKPLNKLKSPTKKTITKGGSQKGTVKNGSADTKTKHKGSAKKQLNLSEFLTPGSSKSNASKASPVLTYEEKMEQRAKDMCKKVIKSIVNMDVPAMTKILEAAANGLPSMFADRIPNEFVKYCYSKALLKKEQKGKDATARAKLRDANKDLQAVNEFLFLHRKLTSAKFEDTWISSSFDLPVLPPIEHDQNLFYKSVLLLAFLQSYRQLLEIRKVPTIFEFLDALDRSEDGFWKTTGPILTIVTDFIRKNQRTIPHFTSGYLNYKVRHITTKTVHIVARKILNPDYNPNAVLGDNDDDDDNGSSGVSSRPESVMSNVENGTTKEDFEKLSEGEPETVDDDDEDNNDDNAQIDKQTKEDDELCERFCDHMLYELTPLEQARIFELLFERVCLSGPVRDSMRNTDAEVKKLKSSIEMKQKKVEKINKDLEELPPMIPEEDYVMYSRAQTISVLKKNQQRKEIEEKKELIEIEIAEAQEAIEEMRGCSRFRAAPLGYDRFYRRYWFLPPTQGLFVEQGAWTTEPEKENEPLVLPTKPKISSYDLSTDQLLPHLHTMLVGGYPSSRAPVKWFYINSIELLEKLDYALNPKGVREAQLKEAIQKSRTVIEASFKHRF